MRRAALAALFATAAAVGLCLLVPPLLGYQRYVITGGSMSGTFDRGSIVFARVVPVGDLRRGDVITYQPPHGTGVRGLITHRIVAITRRGGQELFRTKGDANRSADPWRFTLPHATQARVAFGVPLVGFVPAALSIRWVRMIALGLPALAVALLALADLWRESGAHARAPDRREVPA